MSELSGIVQGIYEIRRELGRGNMGIVYLAYDRSLDREVALKTLHESLADDATAVAAFRAEALHAAKLLSPHIVSTYAVIEHDGRPVIVMEVLQGAPLSRALEDGKTFTASEIIQIGCDVAEALSVAHAHGVVHRDIKPDNIVAATGGPAKVMDFGIASAGAGGAASGVGTAAYMPPEQLLGEADARADLYALGGTLYELATGRVPFEGETPEIMLYRKQNEPPMPPSRFGVALPGTVEKLIMRLLEPDPAHRPQTAEEVRSVLAEAATTAHAKSLSRRGDAGALVGRDADLARVRELLTRAEVGAGAVVHVRGDAGCGRTRFLREVDTEARASGVRVLALHTSIAGAQVPYAALADAFTGAGQPGVAELAAVSEALAAWCGGGAGCVVIDDAQWLDAASAHVLLGHMRLAPEGIVWILAFTAGSSVAGWMDYFGREEPRTDIVMEPLPHDAFIDMLRAQLHQPLFTEDFVRTLYDRTRGVPADVVELVRALQDEGVLVQEKGRWVVTGAPEHVAAPAGMRGRARQRVAALTEAQRALLECAAVQGVRFRPEVVALAMGTSDLVTLQALHGVAWQQSLLEWEDDGSLSFTHPALRDLLYDEMPEALRRAYHRAMAAALDVWAAPEDGAARAAIADHAFRAGDYGRALPHLLQAGARAAQLFEHETAEAFYSRALECYNHSSGGQDTTSEQCELRDTLGRLCADLGRHADAFDHFDIARSLAQAYGDKPRAARLAKLMGDVADTRQDTALALRLYAEAQVLYEETGDVQGLADVYRATGNVYFERSDMPRVLEFYGKTLVIAEATNDRSLIARACNNLGAAYNVRGERAAAISHYQRSIESYRAIEDARGEAQTTHNIGMTYAALHNWAEAVNFYRRAVSLAEDIQFSELQAIARLALAEAEARLGQLESAEKNIDRALATFRERQDRLGVADSYRVKAVIAGRAGREAEAEQYFDESLSVCDEIGGKLQEAECRRDYAVFLSHVDRAEEARLHLELAHLSFIDLQASEHAADVQRLLDALDIAPANQEERAA